MATWKKYVFGKWHWSRPFKSILFIYLILLIVAVLFANRFIYHPPAPGYDASTAGIQIIPSPRGEKIALFYLPAEPGMPTLFWSHGNAEDIGYLRDRFQLFHAMGYGILAYDYPGYGLTQGSPTEDGCYAACQAAWSYLTGPLQVPSKNIIIYGQSVGSGPACWIASHEKAAGLILVSPITSAFRTVTRIPIFPNDQFPNIQLIKSIQLPLLVIHGDQDKVVNQRNGKLLYKRHPGPKTFIDIKGVGHNDLFMLASPEILKALETFRKSLPATSEPQKSPTSLPDTPVA